MKELKEYLKLNGHVKTVYFDKNGNWFTHKNHTITSEMSREEILKADDKAEFPKETAPATPESNEGGEDAGNEGGKKKKK